MGNRLDPKVRGFVIWRLENYLEDKKQLEDYMLEKNMIPSATARLSLTGGVDGGAVGTPTENTAIRIADDRYIQSTQRSVNAITEVLSRCDDIDRQLIDCVYLRKRKTIEGAAWDIFISRTRAFWRVQSFIVAVAKEMGIMAL